jgi:hypothetical protein
MQLIVSHVATNCQAGHWVGGRVVLEPLLNPSAVVLVQFFNGEHRPIHCTVSSRISEYFTELSLLLLPFNPLLTIRDYILTSLGCVHSL